MLGELISTFDHITISAEPTNMSDFSIDRVDFTFPADELAVNKIEQMTFNISLFDDSIDESSSEYFVLHLSLSSAVDSPGPDTDLSISVGEIIDDDGMLNHTFTITCTYY